MRKTGKALVQRTKVVETKEKKEKKDGGLAVPTYTVEGKKIGVLNLPKDLFGVEVNKCLLAQAVRVYMNNLKAHFSDTKTRGEVSGSTRKLYRQKGTGRARRGSLRSPVAVGGGIALGPKFRKVVLDLPFSMKRAALKSALSVRLSEGEILGLASLEGISGKTKQMKAFLDKIGKNDVLMIVDGKNENLFRAVRNLSSVQTAVANQLNTLEVLSRRTLVLTEEAVEKLGKRLLKGTKE